MGLIRKAMSVSSLGLVDFRSDKERVARYSRHTRNAVRAQSQQQAEFAGAQISVAYQQASWQQQQAQMQAAQLAAQHAQLEATRSQAIASPPAPAGWYPDVNGVAHYWDGAKWTDHTPPAVTS
jgi:hypothetical protein